MTRVPADRAYLSRFRFDRLIAAGLGEPPATFRRRLLLERAAWQLQDLEPNCPIEWERRRAAERALSAASLRGAGS